MEPGSAEAQVKVGGKREGGPQYVWGPLEGVAPNLEPSPIVLIIHWIVYSVLASLIGPPTIPLAKPILCIGQSLEPPSLIGPCFPNSLLLIGQLLVHASF